MDFTISQAHRDVLGLLVVSDQQSQKLKMFHLLSHTMKEKHPTLTFEKLQAA